MAKKSNHYVDNKEFFQLMIKRRAENEVQLALGEPKKPICHEIAVMIQLIATSLSTKNNFINYTYRDDMVGDAIENCINYLDNFDPAKSSNPFAYFTQICYFAFIRRINKENKHGDLKKKFVTKMVTDNAPAYGTQVHDNNEDFTNTSLEFLKDNYI